MCDRGNAIAHGWDVSRNKAQWSWDERSKTSVDVIGAYRGRTGPRDNRTHTELAMV